MNILLITRIFPVKGGTETVTRELANAFARGGHSVCVCYAEQTELQGCLLDSRVKLFKLPDYQKPSKITSKNNISFLRNIFLSEQINIVINQVLTNIEYSELVIKARENLKIPLISCRHASFSIPFCQVFKKENMKRKYIPYRLYLYLKKYVYFKRINKGYDLSDVCVFLSEHFIEQYIAKYPNKKLDKLRAIPNPLTKFNHSPPQLNEKSKSLVFIGRMEESSKRMSLMIRAWELLADCFPDWELIMVGKGDDLEKTKLISKNLPRITFTGYVNVNVKYYYEGSIFLMTSSFEGFGMTLLEAQYFGCVPVVMDSVPVFHDIIENMQNGILTPNDDIAAFAEKLQLLMDNQNLREEMAKNAMESVKKFSVENIVEKWENLFKELTQTAD